MNIQLQIKINDALFLRNPESSELGKKILKHSILLIYKLGFEAFTFKKLAEDIGTTEAGVYRYFENKHKLLIYLTAWYLSWLQYQINFNTNNITDPINKLQRVIKLLVLPTKDNIQTNYINEHLLHQVVILEGVKAYRTKQVIDDDKLQFFKPYKDLSVAIGNIISECNPKYKYPNILASTIIETAHFQILFTHNLPLLTETGKNIKESEIISFLNELVFISLKKG